MTSQPNPLTLSDLRDGDHIEATMRGTIVSVGENRINIHWDYHPSKDSWDSIHGEQLAQATIRRAPREFVKGDRVKSKYHSDGVAGEIVSVNGDLAWVLWSNESHIVHRLSDLRHADEVGG